MLTFKEWFLLTERTSTATRGKIGLYPPLYTQVFNYPPQEVITWSADAITYMSPKDTDAKGKYSNWGKFKPYIWQDGDETTAPDPNKIPKSLM